MTGWSWPRSWVNLRAKPASTIHRIPGSSWDATFASIQVSRHHQMLVILRPRQPSRSNFEAADSRSCPI